MKTFIDKAKRKIEIGDDVTFHPPGYSGSFLEIGKVIGFSPKKIRIQYNNEKITRYPHECVVITYQLKINKQDYPENFI